MHSSKLDFDALFDYEASSVMFVTRTSMLASRTVFNYAEAKQSKDSEEGWVKD